MRFAGGRDYYDSVLAHGRDETLFFDRSAFAKARYIMNKDAGFSTSPPLSLDFKGEMSWRKYSQLTINGREHLYTPYVVWFAGERFAGIRLEIRDTRMPSLAPQWFWGREAFIAHLKAMHVGNSKEPWDPNSVVRAESLNRLYSYRPSRAEIDWMVADKIAIAISSDHHYHGNGATGSTEPGWYLNSDGLSAMGFAKALDPYSAFQKLSQWVGGVLSADNKPMLKISDEKVILKKHGFDKRSFKHRPID